MLDINNEGIVINPRVIPRRFSQIERGPLRLVKGIVIHQTNAARLESTFASYRSANSNGAHFLIDKNGSIYQTASVASRTNHVGRLRARCLAEYTCRGAEFEKATSLPGESAAQKMNRIEMQKTIPRRYPSNMDSIGIEIVGEARLPTGKTPPARATPGERIAFINENSVYEPVTGAQNVSLRWLVDELTKTLRIPASEIFRHPEVSRKNPTEASTAKWN